ncbi:MULTISPECIES: GGDEF domain-containing protein [unclassified Mesorhizobium]|uniref:GGDEF domain-containing protein n=1 Tax=unclassified Mesorhizobium TaxID=325217 RepID=UPI000FD703F7|nr:MULTISPECIES: GGDEF domain-containing protein [unclassified Mesorhizobium]TGR37291.1 GGDEF domain-containing protein [bacterium M00.F.Ca.ET.199.01.1.1]TGU21945.1 GGDEF domain-containing protein [bacterium M00.F.Ca.ET.156.01.1.1]TGV82612.1 GGDEF domain-containing protein [Mesorhizobium sp. M00.F.Ca.ET.149.01.1.1]TGR17299.1 GGDEF domain-containing protein [Mesorhizobium sp. M8A.F.Ca.ET.202.01.1.1]TGR19127.1 GGDEF domain-containing protein [Mesorhizobium sp. M8A.F.Ca.ET.197.01.1.1]
MNSIILKSAAIAFASVAASLLLTLIVVPAMGFPITRTIWLTSTLCPLVLAWAACASTFWQSDRLKNAHRELARAHAQLAAAHRRLSEKASRDDMTGMLNRESFFAALDGSRRKSDRGALLIIDADHFKTINDNFGHLTGDDALLLIAGAIERGVRGGDVLGRIGGEEFGAFLVGATEKEAKRVAERIRREVELIRFRPVDERTIPLTVSIGGTVCDVEANVSELMRAADRRLYQAKHAGRNLTILDTDISEAA